MHTGKTRWRSKCIRALYEEQTGSGGLLELTRQCTLFSAISRGDGSNKLRSGPKEWHGALMRDPTSRARNLWGEKWRCIEKKSRYVKGCKGPPATKRRGATKLEHMHNTHKKTRTRKGTIWFFLQAASCTFKRPTEWGYALFSCGRHGSFDHKAQQQPAGDYLAGWDCNLWGWDDVVRR